MADKKHLKSGSLNLPEPSGPVQACIGIPLPLPLTRCDAFPRDLYGREPSGLLLTHYSGRVTHICVFSTVKLGTSASSP